MSDKFDLLVIGAGTAGLVAAQKAASYGVKVAIVERGEVGGTCVNRGCIPKKLMVYAADFARQEPLATSYGWQECSRQINWSLLMKRIHHHLDKLNQTYCHRLREKGIEIIEGEATFTGDRTIKVKDRQISADKIIIAVGGHPIKLDLRGKELAITSREMFHLPEIPKRLAIVGGGYIGVEFGSMMNAFGSKVTIIETEEQILSGFDGDLRAAVQKGLICRGIEVFGSTTAKEIEQTEEGLKLKLDNNQTIAADTVLLATGRAPNTKSLGLDKTGVELGEKGEVKVDKYSRTTNEHIFAVGDCSDRVPLTPVAKAEAAAAVATIYGKEPQPMDYTYVTSAVFARPEAATVGMSEEQARDKYGENLRCYRQEVQPLQYGLCDTDESTKVTIKLLVTGAEERVLGMHMIGHYAAEIIQSLGVAVRKGITKADLDNSFGIHPTVGEEFLSLD